MSSKPSGLRFSSVSSQTNQQPPSVAKTAANFVKNSTISIVGKKPSTIVYTKAIKSNPPQTMQQTKKLSTNQSPYGKPHTIRDFRNFFRLKTKEIGLKNQAKM